MMKIDSYVFGSMIIDGQTYEKDLIAFPERVVPNWWRKEGHRLSLEDLGEILKVRPEVLVVGKGAQGYMEVPIDLKSTLGLKGINVVEKNTDVAVEFYNDLIRKGKNVAGVFHLTC